MMKNRAGWLALIVLAIASLLMVFFVLPRVNHDANPIGNAINAASNAVKDAVTEPQPSTRTPEAPKPAEQQAAATPPAAPAAPRATAPAAPQPASRAAVMATPSFDVLRVEPDGSTVIAGRAEPHSTLEVTDGTSVVAKVNVGPSGDFAAILDRPLPPGDHQLVLKATGKDGKAMLSEETATVSVPADKGGKLLAMVTTPGKASRLIATPTADAAKPAAPAAPATQTAAAPAAPSVETAAAMPALPSASSGLAGSAPSIPVSAPASAAPAAVAGSAELHITAVEIEGSKIFIAGVSKAGTQVRGEADAKPVGTARAGQDGAFVIEGTTELSVGDHRISVEALGPGGQVLVRVEVPFNRPAGDQVAAIAAAPSSVGDPAFDKLRNDTVRAFNLLRGLYDDGRVPSLEQMVAARSATSIALRSLSEYRLPVEAAAAARSIAETTARDAATALAALDALPKDVASVGAGLKQIGEMIARAVGPVIARELKGIEIAAATGAGGARVIQQAALNPSDRSSVIIRRGDTLWQISRRMYGQGVRYTTIYLANQDQINNPDVIQPGQIFGVPDKALPNSEELHRERMQHRRS